MAMRLFCAGALALSFLAGNFSQAAAFEPPIMKMSSKFSLFDSSRSPSSVESGPNLQAELDRFLEVRKPASAKRDWEVKSDGKIEFDKNVWSEEKDPDGGELFTLKKLSSGEKEVKRSVIRNDDQSIRTISEYKISSDKKENFWFVFFLDQKLAAATICTDKTSDGLRSCTTAIPSVCQSLPASKVAKWTLPSSVVPDVDLVEKRAIATVVTMRGEEHQMENMAKTGNLIGLKDKMQTTRGRLSSAPVKSEFVKAESELCTRARL